MSIAWRTALFAPGHDRALIGKALRSGADAVILDLEDGVSAPSRSGARLMIDEVANVFADSDVDLVVRINAPWLMAFEDLAHAVRPHVRAVMVPKAADPARLATLSELIGEFELRQGMACGSVGLLPLIETPAALPFLDDLVQHSRVLGLFFGSEDYSLHMGCEPTPDLLDLPCRMIAAAAAAQGKAAFAVPKSLADFNDEAGYRAAVELARAYGSSGALCIHPTQVRIASETFAPNAAELASARAMLKAWENAQAQGNDVVALNGKMIDRPVVRRAERLLVRERVAAAHKA